MNNSARAIPGLPRTGWRETAVLLGVAWLVPMLVHLIPWSGHRPLGVYLLPVFWTTFVAVYCYGALSGLLVGLVTPIVNLLLTGLPVSTGLGAMGLEVVFFTLLAAGLISRRPNFRFTAPLAWLVGKGLAVTVQYFIPVFAETEYPWQHLAHSAQNGLAGLAVLTALNLLLVAVRPKTNTWEQE